MSVPADIAAWLACLVFVVLLFNALAKARSNLTGSAKRMDIANQPVEVDGKIEVSTKGRRFSGYACDDRHARIDERVAALEIFVKGEVGRIHDKIDVVERRQSDALTAAINSLHQQISDMPGKIIGLLRSTGQMKDHHND